MSLLSRRDWGWVQSPVVHAIAAVCYFSHVAGLAVALVPLGHPLVTVLGLALILIFGTLLGQGWIALVVGEFVDRFRAAATGIDTMKVEKTYDRARKAEHDGDLELALRIYAEAAEADAADPEPLRRMADLRAGRGELAEALELLERASARAKEPEEEAPLLLRRADLLERSGRRDEAAGLIERVARDYAGTPAGRGARERLDALRR